MLTSSLARLVSTRNKWSVALFSHIHIGTQDLTRAAEFYDRVLEPLALPANLTDVRSGMGWLAAGRLWSAAAVPAG